LTVEGGPNEGTVYEIKDVCLLGRALDCQVLIPDLTVSRRHARITRVNERHLVEDLGSGNGTYVNDQPVTRHFLSNGDVIRVSNLRLRFSEINSTWQIPDSVTMVGTMEQLEHQPHIVRTVDARRSLLDDAVQLTDPGDMQRVAERLRTVYAVSEAISNILELNQLLPEILNHLFAVFPEVERAFILLEDESKKLTPKAAKRRTPAKDNDNEDIALSRTILNEVMTKRHSVLSRDAMADARFLSGHSVANFGIRSMMCAPLVWRGEVLGIVYVDSHTLGTFSKADLELLNGIAGQAAVAVGTARLHGELMKRQRLEQDLQLAERIQQSFLPRRLPKLPGYAFGARYDPAYEIGGDFYDFIRLPSERLGIVVGDVSGKGISAALIMARLTRDLRYFALAESDPGRVLMWMNRAVLEAGQEDMFVTLIYALLDVPRGEITFANAGHMPPVVRRRQEQVVDLFDKTSGLPLGVLPDTTYDSETFPMNPGDSVLFFTDGLVEAMSPSREMYGMDRLGRVVKKGSSEAQAILDRTMHDMQSHVADAPQFDDTTIVCIGYEPSQAPRRRDA
jgi:serine phosphatase RsbU (regulator of sigma subunit)